jgi:AcrR family transcriptional regulator
MELSTRQLEIVEATGRLLTSYGLGGLTIKNLAKEMRFAESALYRHFKNKEEIIVSLLQYLVDNIEERMRRISLSDQPEDNFSALFRSQFEFFRDKPYFVAAVFSDSLMEENKNINKMILKLINIKTQYLVQIIQDGQAKGVFTNEIPTEQIVNIIMGSFQLQMLKWRISNFSFDIIETGDQMIQSLLTLIRK